MKHDGSYIEETTHCDSTSQELIDSRECVIPLDTLIVAPYSLVLNEEIFAKIMAENVYGYSPESAPGNGGLVKLIPDAPINLANDPAVTDAT